MFIFLRGFRRPFKWRGSYPRGLITGAGACKQQFTVFKYAAAQLSPSHISHVLHVMLMSEDNRVWYFRVIIL